jgi:single-strand DNA-binding protein
MAKGVNKVILIGNLGKDPEVRYTQSGTAVSNLRLAVTERRKDGDGWKDQTEWIDVVCFGKTAENVGQYLQKGRQIYVDGRMQTRSYKDKEGVEKWRTEVVANEVVFIGGREDGPPRERPAGGGGGGGGGGGRPQRDAPPADDQGAPPEQGFYDDDLPF